MNPLSKAYWIAKGVGWENVPRRIWQSLRTRSGLLNRTLTPEAYAEEKREWASKHESDIRKRWGDARQRFPAAPSQAQLHALLPADAWDEHVTQQCENALRGKYPFFSRWSAELDWPPNFNLDPVHSIRWPSETPWNGIAKSGPPRNDIKLVWEASRLSLAYLLTRQYQYSQEEKWAEAVWTLLDSWIEQNPVNRSVAWACGQEVAFRLMALVFSAIHTLSSPAASKERLTKLEHLVWQSAKRIEANINYALSQKNNHGISEASGLWTTGVLFPNFADAQRWKRKGDTYLRQEVARQVYDDGSFVQHSVSYHRVLLDNLCWLEAISRASGVELPAEINQKAQLASRWLGDFIDTKSGGAPNLGTNDGANVLPLSCSDYADYRPTLQAAAAFFLPDDCNLPRGPWSEKSLWLNAAIEPGSDGPRAKESPTWKAEQGGYYSVSGPNSRIYLRAANYRDRPGQSDQLHVDLWHDGVNILRDAGSYFYYHDDNSLRHYFYSVAAHNTVQVGSAEQMIKGPNFLWFQWPKAKAHIASSTEIDATVNVRSQTDYRHRRHIERNEDIYTITDWVEGSDSFTLRWRLPPNTEWTRQGTGVYKSTLQEKPYSIEIQTDNATVELETCFESKYYGEKQTCPMLIVKNANGQVITRVGNF